jgi:hypothetical protein
MDITAGDFGSLRDPERALTAQRGVPASATVEALEAVEHVRPNVVPILSILRASRSFLSDEKKLSIAARSRTWSTGSSNR